MFRRGETPRICVGLSDTGNQRILRLDVDSGEKLDDLPTLNEPLEQHWEMHNVDWEVFVDSNLDDPTGMTLSDGRLFISNHGTSELIAFDLDNGREIDRIDVDDGVRGITIGPDDHLWLASYDDEQILRVDP